MTRESQHFRTDGGQYADRDRDTSPVSGARTTGSFTDAVGFTDADAERLATFPELDLAPRP
jgi:hypothetical protein